VFQKLKGDTHWGFPFCLLEFPGDGPPAVRAVLNPTDSPILEAVTEQHLAQQAAVAPSGERQRAQAHRQNERGARLHEQEDCEGAIACFTKATQLDPMLSGAFHNGGLAFRESGQLAFAMADLTRYLELSPSAIGYLNRGLTFSDAGMWAESIEDFTTAIELDPELDRAYYERALVYDSFRADEIQREGLSA
jgi:tetratricopeptide (TPR) repeat protein